MRNQNRLIDRTFLSLDLAEERMLIHRDYLAHCHRWSHVVKFLSKGHAYKDAVVLDVGCGKEFPMAKLLYVNKFSPLAYIGVDANKLEIPAMLKDKKIPMAVYQQADFCALEYQDLGFQGQKGGEPCWFQPNVLTCFETVEHVSPEHARRMLAHMLKVTALSCNYFISTPCYNGDAAGNHINEMTFPALGSLIEDLGFHIEGVWGTFASIRDYKHELGAWTYHYGGEHPQTLNLMPVFEVLSEYYDTNVLATIFAPMFPQYSRNCLWHLTRKADDDVRPRRFSKLVDAPTPWSQHDDWRALAGGELPTGEVAEVVQGVEEVAG